MAFHRQPVGAGEARRPRPDHRDTFARGRGPPEGMLVPRHERVGGMTLQLPDLDRLALGLHAHAGLFAERLGRADAGAHAAQDVLVEDRLRRRLGHPGRDLADEQRDVDLGRAGRDAGRVVAEIAAVGGHLRLVAVKRRVQVGKVARDLVFRQSARNDPRSGRAVGHRWIPVGLAFPQRCTVLFFIKW